MKSETLATAAATTAARIDDTTIAAVTEEEATAVADLNATTEVAGLIETIGRTMAGIGIVQNATTTISLSVMNATDAVNQEETAEADRTTEGSKAVDNEVVIRPMMYLALSYDHRIIDGREAVSFLARIKELVEDPRRIVLGV